MPTRILYLVTEDGFFRSDTLPTARAAKAAGFEVHVATTLSRAPTDLQAEGFTVHSTAPWHRSVNPIRALRKILEIRRLYRRIEPDIVHQVAIMPVILGSFASLGLSLKRRLNLLTGLGYVFVSDEWRARLARPVMRAGFRFLLNRPNSLTIVQNEDDRRELTEAGLVDQAHMLLIRGSGIDTAHFAPLPDPHNPPFTVAYVGRMLRDKGVPALVEAVRRLNSHEPPIRLILAGGPDPRNPGTLNETDLRSYDSDPNIDWLGHVDDVRDIWAQAHLAALPSRREGLPKSLMEAAACGRALLASDVPGCREIAQDGVNAVLVPPDDPTALARAISGLAKDPPRRRALAARSRALVDGALCTKAVTESIDALYRSAISA